MANQIDSQVVLIPNKLERELSVLAGLSLVGGLVSEVNNSDLTYLFAPLAILYSLSFATSLSTRYYKARRQLNNGK